MRTSALAYIACPLCEGTLIAVADTTAADGHLMSGRLRCKCGKQYPIRDGVPRLTPSDADLPVNIEQQNTADRFAVEWNMFAFSAEYYEQQFLDWISPLGPQDFVDKVVLEGGCGKGRHTALVAAWGARAIISLDLGDAVDVAFAATRHLSNVHVVQGDVTRPPVGRIADIAFSVGVLHHIPTPLLGFRGLVSKLTDEGRIVVWVYGYESNEWIVRLVSPFRTRVTSKIPENLLYYSSLAPAAALKTILQLYRVSSIAKRLPYGSYLHYISNFPLREVHHIVFDQLVTPIAHYLPREEVASWFQTEDFHDVEIAWHNENSWRGTAVICRDDAPAAALSHR